MSMRTFVDSSGNEWEVFDVVPPADERRSRERRTTESLGEASMDRRERDRRLTVGDMAHLSTIHDGWLCFERGADRRRLSPIPGDWRRCPDGALEEYCRSARPVRPLSRDTVSR